MLLEEYVKYLSCTGIKFSPIAKQKLSFFSLHSFRKYLNGLHPSSWVFQIPPSSWETQNQMLMHSYFPRDAHIHWNINFSQEGNLPFSAA